MIGEHDRHPRNNTVLLSPETQIGGGGFWCPRRPGAWEQLSPELRHDLEAWNDLFLNHFYGTWMPPEVGYTYHAQVGGLVQRITEELDLGPDELAVDIWPTEGLDPEKV
ncbi:hypothetical protein [Parenemella sanctibonifatiensis]|uniref:Uncharacterized protein n=2 Tax=Parenemella sanctibonifatiensis TaxID=2016505 RepID=A0A255EDM1_9ACTN|nr:hypothetical protein [Parenemella sanctibonifatiensis]OYN89658.1 hypothetical protein CGZ92_02790 [Parenemella sanctibonifatiensis]